jgi:hypothetical protein
MIVYGSRVWYVLNVVQCGAKLISVYMIYVTLGNSVFNFETESSNLEHKFDISMVFA